jgi:hypothetical protein
MMSVIYGIEEIVSSGKTAYVNVGLMAPLCRMDSFILMSNRKTVKL